MTCSLCQQREALHARGAVPHAERGLRVDLPALRRVLGRRAEVLERQARQAKASGRPRANVGAIWRYFTTSTYESGDLPVIATREALQNAVDAIRAAIKKRQIRAGEGRFSVVWTADSRSLTWEDNGGGMDERQILDKFLSLGDSGKSTAESSEEAAGGFGVAKAVILGVSKSFRWEMHTRNNLAVARGMDADVEVFEAEHRQGTRITVHDIPEEQYWAWDHGRQEHVALPDRIRELLGACDLPDIALVFNGQPVQPLFSRRGGSKVEVEADWGAGTTARVRAYRRPPGDMSGAWYVRLGGLIQFKRPSARGSLKADVVIDLTTSVRPGAAGYPLTAARDQLQGAAGTAFRELARVVERENESTGRSDEDEVFEPDGHTLPMLDGELAALLADPQLRHLFGQASGGLLDLHAHRAQIAEQPVDSAAPAGTPAERSESIFEQPVAFPGPLLIDPRKPDQEQIRRVALFLQQADVRIAERQEGQDFSQEARYERGVFAPDVELALHHLAQGWGDEKTLARIELALEEAVQQGVSSPAGAPLTQAGPVVKAGPVSAGNPFGAYAGLRISKTSYDKARARKFKANVRKWVPFLLVWEGTLRLIAAELRVRRPFKPGFVLDDTVVGLASKSENGPLIISIHPDRLAEVVDAHRQRPIAIASFLHHVAVHEFAHADGRLGKGHNEEYVVAREDLGHATGHLLPVIAGLVSKVLQLPTPPDSDAARAERLATELARAQERVTRLRAELAELKRALAKAAPKAPKAPDAQQTPRTRLTWSTLEGWLAAWDTIAHRPISAKRYADLSAHLSALPDHLVEQAQGSSYALDRLEAILAQNRPPQGRRAGHPSTRLLDAIDRTRSRARRGKSPPTVSTLGHPLLDATEQALRRRPPPGLELADVEGFFARNRPALLAAVRQAVGAR